MVGFTSLFQIIILIKFFFCLRGMNLIIFRYLNWDRDILIEIHTLLHKEFKYSNTSGILIRTILGFYYYDFGIFLI